MFGYQQHTDDFGIVKTKDEDNSDETDDEEEGYSPTNSVTTQITPTFGYEARVEGSNPGYDVQVGQAVHSTFGYDVRVSGSEDVSSPPSSAFGYDVHVEGSNFGAGALFAPNQFSYVVPLPNSDTPSKKAESLRIAYSYYSHKCVSDISLYLLKGMMTILWILTKPYRTTKKVFQITNLKCNLGTTVFILLI